MPPYPCWRFFPAHRPPPEWVLPLVGAFDERRAEIDSAVDHETYVFGEDWEQLSQMTKAEILTNELQRDRVIHREGWDGRIRDILA